ncbi:Transcriptional regulator [Hahella chejuensis KCTC 2396]|uniref:Transcriptional regulator n=1 Tax=Hahella chejuensis (strain KCTC 2396) TaxID=349521 RepID=Q2SC04_HAHCH|nr:HTH-type transcriptional repressor FabR [Hahella chejuensis]ABC31820.1 Transcriptional regulator [Hahella chejuensis KCTC 2396]
MNQEQKLESVATRTPQGRKAVISREDVISAALKLAGPHRSVSTLSLREVAREAGIAPNSFYRHFRDIDELAVALIERAGASLRKIIGEARNRASMDTSVVRSSVEAFVEQLSADEKFLHILLREGNVGSDAFKYAVERQLCFFEEELCVDLVRLAKSKGTGIMQPELVSKAITRLVFAVAATALDLPFEKHAEISDQLERMIRMIIVGSQVLAEIEPNPAVVATEMASVRAFLERPEI